MAEPPNDSVLRSVLARVSRDFDVTLTDPAALHDQERWEHAQRAVDRAIGQLQREGQLGGADPTSLAEAAVREAVGLGPLEQFFADESVRELVVEGPQRLVADLGRGLEPVPGSFSSSDAVAVVARRLLAQAGEEMESGRMVYEAALPYGPYVTVVLPPIAIRGPIIEVRRMARGLSVDVLTERGMMSPEMAGVLREAIATRRNVLVTGTVGSGVTTVLGALATLSDDHERLVTVEEVPDLAIERDHVLSFGTAGGAGGLGLRQVVAQASRLRADRLVVDDIRGAEAFDVFTELASRQPGNLMGVHCGSAPVDPGQGGLAEVQSLMKLAGPNDDAALSQLIARVVHVVVEVGYDDQGARRIQRVAEVVGANGTSVLTEELFYWDGEFVRGS